MPGGRRVHTGFGTATTSIYDPTSPVTLRSKILLEALGNTPQSIAMAFELKTELHFEPYDRLSPSKLASELSGKHILITGGGHGIGASVVRAFAEAGVASIAIAGRTEAKLKSTVEDIKKSHPKTSVEYHVVDVTSQQSVKAMFDAIKSPLNVLVNNAGFLSTPGNFITTDLKDWWKSYEVNILGVAYVTQAFLQARAKQNASDQAVIINQNTVAAYNMLLPNFSAYSGSKSGIWRAMELIGQDVNDASVLPGGARIINVHPGLVESEMGVKGMSSLQEYSGVASQLSMFLTNKMLAGLIGMIPSTNPTLTAGFIAWAATDEASFLANRLAWVNWDVDELISRKEEIMEGDKLRTAMS
jgi:NAD(P)-dependent dehydrogenase (short-subunit alcohol dehydrogenase family)